MGRALGDLGHLVTYFDYDRKPLFQRLLPRILRSREWERQYLNYVNESVLDLAQRVKPDFFLCVKGVQFYPETICAIGAMGVVTIGYWIDDPLDHSRSLVNAPAYQYYFTNDASSVECYRNAGIPRIYHLPSAADTQMFYPLPGVSPLADVVFVGTHSPYRESIITQLQDFDLRVYGPGWHKASLKRSCIYPEAFGAQTNEIFNRAKINLNIHNWFGQGSAMNLRLFEVPAAGGFLLTDWVAEIDEAYRENEHLACWRSIDELREKIAYYLLHEGERRAIASNGHKHFLRHHSYKARIDLLLSRLA